MISPKPLLYWAHSAPGGESKTTTQWDGNESQLEVCDDSTFLSSLINRKYEGSSVRNHSMYHRDEPRTNPFPFNCLNPDGGKNP